MIRGNDLVIYCAEEILAPPEGKFCWTAVVTLQRPYAQPEDDLLVPDTTNIMPEREPRSVRFLGSFSHSTDRIRAKGDYHNAGRYHCQTLLKLVAANQTETTGTLSKTVYFMHSYACPHAAPLTPELHEQICLKYL